MFSSRYASGIVIALACAIGICGSPSANADSVWSGAFPDGEDPTQLPGGVSGNVDWSIVGTTLTITIENTTSASEPNSGWVLSGILFDSTKTLTAPTAEAEKLIIWDDVSDKWIDDPGPIDVADYWAFKGGAGTSTFKVFGDEFDYALGAVGDINASEGLGNGDIIGTGAGGQPDGIDYAITSDNTPGFDPPPDSNSPLIQNLATFTFSVPDGTTAADITNVTAYYGTDGAPLEGFTPSGLIPAPSALVGLLSMGLMGLLGLAWRRRRRAA